MKNNLLLLLIVVTGLSCNRYYYRPNAVNTPLFTGGGQAHFAGTMGVSGESKSNGNDWGSEFYNLQAAISPVNHLAVLLDYSSYNYHTNNPDNNGNVNASAHLLEGAVGGYYAKGRKFKLVTDLFVGYGAGPIWSDVNMNIDRFYVQPGIGVRSPWFDAAFNLRISNVNYSHFNANGHDNAYLQDHALIDTGGVRIDGRSYGFLEPAFTIRGGYRFLKFQMQTVFAQDVSNVPWHYNGFMFTVGIYFSLEDALHAR
ncbi:hypothetical protein [Dinghuibacter silviterrae]|uniref:Uncharacterized protein n=1 Tax=Dinghuibacter silviterrae TaxID=1539049 RepID=A0A4R8DTR8_9BACT|nr:hypothetical protein [Dinghuibacter silviterrae]TDX01710.1 hypothetical protein EDB95_2752 [Dinghuibacter silviterrae]